MLSENLVEKTSSSVAAKLSSDAWNRGLSGLGAVSTTSATAPLSLVMDLMLHYA